MHAHTLTRLLNGSAHETQSFSTELRKTKKCQRTLDTNLLERSFDKYIFHCIMKVDRLYLNGGLRMDKVYILVLLLMIIPILICIKYARKVKSEVASSIVKCLVLVIITILSNGVFVLSDNQLFSYVMEGLYLFSFDVLLIYIYLLYTSGLW